MISIPHNIGTPTKIGNVTVVSKMESENQLPRSKPLPDWKKLGYVYPKERLTAHTWTKEDLMCEVSIGTRHENNRIHETMQGSGAGGK